MPALTSNRCYMRPLIQQSLQDIPAYKLPNGNDITPTGELEFHLACAAEIELQFTVHIGKACSFDGEYCHLRIRQ